MAPLDIRIGGENHGVVQGVVEELGIWAIGMIGHWGYDWGGGLPGDQTTGRQGQLASKFRSRLAAKLAASLYYVLFYYIDIVDISHCRKTK